MVAIRLVPDSNGGIKLNPGTTSSIRLLRPCCSNNHCSTEGLRPRPNLAATCPMDIYCSRESFPCNCSFVVQPTHTSLSSKSLAFGWAPDMNRSGRIRKSTSPRRRSSSGSSSSGSNSKLTPGASRAKRTMIFSKKTKAMKSERIILNRRSDSAGFIGSHAMTES
uniref:NodD2 n=1 Tax=Rhizobium pisi TaxID=574561 RepID=I3WBL8_9HYPH|nr:NodD2 [Rhizobium pisi]